MELFRECASVSAFVNWRVKGGLLHYLMDSERAGLETMCDQPVRCVRVINFACSRPILAYYSVKL